MNVEKLRSKLKKMPKNIDLVSLYDISKNNKVVPGLDFISENPDELHRLLIYYGVNKHGRDMYEKCFGKNTVSLYWLLAKFDEKNYHLFNKYIRNRKC